MSVGALVERDQETLERLGVRWERATDLEEPIRELGLDIPDEHVPKVIELITQDYQDQLRRVTKSRDYSKTSVWASEHFSCHRKRYYKTIGADETEPPKTQEAITFGIGGYLGLLMAIKFAQLGVLVDAERYFRVDLGEDLIKSGRTDVVIEDPTNNGKVVPVEVKSTKERGFRTTTSGRGWTMVGSDTVPRAYHVAQLFDYIEAQNNDPNEEDTDYGYLVYIDKNNSDFAIHRVWYSQEFSDEVLADDREFVREVEIAVDGGELPPRHPKGGVGFYEVDYQDNKAGDLNKNKCSFPCAWKTGTCSFLSLCWGDEIAAAKAETSDGESNDE